MRRAHRVAACLVLATIWGCTSPPDPVAAPPPSVASTWTVGSAAPVPVTEVAGAAFQGRIYLAGGFSAAGTAVTEVQVYDPVADSWSTGPELPEPVHHAALVARGGELYLLGGYVGSTFARPTDAVRRLDLARDAWVDGPRLPSPRAAGAAADDGARIVYGGGVGRDGLIGAVLALEGQEWRLLGELSEPREHLGAAADGAGRVWLLGGRTGGLDSNLSTVDLVEAGAVRAVGALPTPRGGVAGFYAPGIGACLAGGEQPDGTLAEVECLTPAGTPVRLPDLNSPRHGLAAGVVDGVAYVVAGRPEPALSVSDAVEALRLQ